MEVSISMGLFFLLLSIVYPNILLFQKSYTKLTNYIEHRFQERELQRLLHQLLSHGFPDGTLKQNFFVMEKLREKHFREDLIVMERQQINKGKLVFFSCVFWKEEELLHNRFVLYFEKETLYLAEHIHGVFQTGNKILLLKHVDGYFEKDGNFLKIFYWKKGGRDRREVIYESLYQK